MLSPHLYHQEVKRKCDIVFECPTNNDIKMLICLCRKMLCNAYFETFSRHNVSKLWTFTQCFTLFIACLYWPLFYAMRCLRTLGRISFLLLPMIWWVTFVWLKHCHFYDELYKIFQMMQEQTFMAITNYKTTYYNSFGFEEYLWQRLYCFYCITILSYTTTLNL